MIVSGLDLGSYSEAEDKLVNLIDSIGVQTTVC